MWGMDGWKREMIGSHSNTSTHLGLQPTSYLFQKSFQRASFFAFMAEPLRPRCACTLSVSCTRHSNSSPCFGRGASHQRPTLTRNTSQKHRKLRSRLGEQGERRSLLMKVHRAWDHGTPLLRLGLQMVLRHRRLCNSKRIAAQEEARGGRALHWRGGQRRRAWPFRSWRRRCSAAGSPAPCQIVIR